MSLLQLKNVKSEVEGKEILKGLNLTINKGEVHVIMGPNGAGKSTLASILVGHPKHELVDGEIILDGENINEDAVDERAKKGIFLSFQYLERFFRFPSFLLFVVTPQLFLRIPFGIYLFYFVLFLSYQIA